MCDSQAAYVLETWFEWDQVARAERLDTSDT